MTRQVAAALLAGLILGFAIARATTATSRPAREPSPTDLRPVVVPTLAATPTFGAAPSLLPPPEAAGTQPTATVAASEPESEPAPGPTPVPPAPGRIVAGTASWYCLPGVSACTAGYAASGLYAAAGPALRVGAWRGRYVMVNGLRVRLIDWCQCPSGRIIDLYASVFGQLAPLSRGTITVTVRWN